MVFPLRLAAVQRKHCSASPGTPSEREEMKKLVTASALLLATSLYAAPGVGPVKSVDRFITGELGSLNVNITAKAAGEGQWGEAAREFATGKSIDLGGRGTEQFAVRSTLVDDETNLVHVRLDQSLAGLRVYGGEMIVHADIASGAVEAMNGRFLPDSEDLPRHPRMNAMRALDHAVTSMGLPSYDAVDAPELAYVIDADGVATLAWKRTIAYESTEGPERDIIFADATTGYLVARHPQIHRGKSLKTYTAKNGTALPGTLVITRTGTTTTGSTTDAVVNNAHNNANTTYDYYYSRHARDSYTGTGATITSTVHYGSRYNNAFWNGTQMVYGDGDGTTFSPLGNSLDVVAHEITHAVTERTAGLVYSNESGALNEGMSDVFGASAEYYRNSGSTNIWKIGDEIYTPGTAGDALRYMNNPTQDGSSKDYYPERYVGTSDNGGVHWNSGIANLAYYLLSVGGKHPRGKTTIQVTGIGIPAAEKIFYKALTAYMTSSTNFAGARTATLNAASALYGSTSSQYTQVGNAWAAVGVGGSTAPSTCTTVNGSLSGTGAQAFEPLIGANRYYYSSTSGTHTGKLTGTGADFDLYLQKWNGSAWAIVARSEGATSTESITYSGTAGYYRYRIYSYSGSGTYSLCYTRPN